MKTLPQQRPPIDAVCPVCKVRKPEDRNNINDVVMPRLDWRTAGRPERKRIEDKILEAEMCFECFKRIQDEWSPKAPVFDNNGNRRFL